MNKLVFFENFLHSDGGIQIVNNDRYEKFKFKLIHPATYNTFHNIPYIYYNYIFILIKINKFLSL